VALRDPVAVYNAATNMEAQFLCNLLCDAGVEAFLTEDISRAGTWFGGLVPEIHKPQVWVERDDVERAVPVLEEYERRTAKRRSADEESGRPIPAVCEDCGEESRFPANQRGTTQECPHCGAYMDVGGDEHPEGIFDPQRPSVGEEGFYDPQKPGAADEDVVDPEME
jgi:hypothetical protein